MTEQTDFDTDSLSTGGNALQQMLAAVSVDEQLKALKQDVLTTKSPSKRDALVKKIKYLAGVKRIGLKPEEAFILHNMPVVPPLVRPSMQTGGNRIEYADVNNLYKDHMTVNAPLAKAVEYSPNDHLIEARRDLYDGARAIFGVGDAISGNSRGKQLKGFIKQIGGETGPKGGFFHSKLLSKKQDFSGRGTIYAEPDLGFNEAAVPKDMLWTMYEFHLIRDLVKNGYSYVEAKKAVEARNHAATASFNKLIKHIPIILNRAPTLMRTNITAHFPVPIEGKTIGVNPLHLPLFAGDYDGDALTVHVPMTPEAIEEAKKKLLPEHHIYDYRKGLGASMVAPGHEAIVGAMHITEPDQTQKPVRFKTEQDALAALKAGTIDENTPISIG
jgi:DNA-directed RNA polymerase subunit beta'